MNGGYSVNVPWGSATAKAEGMFNALSSACQSQSFLPIAQTRNCAPSIKIYAVLQYKTIHHIFYIFLGQRNTDDPLGMTCTCMETSFCGVSGSDAMLKIFGETCRLIEVFGADQATCAGQSE